MTRIGIFGGSFDPIHYGHLILAETCRETLALDRLLLVPAATSPLKPNGPVASNQARLAMCKLALDQTPGIEVDSLELDRGGVSYTLDTVKSLREREGENAKLFLLVGSDSVEQFERWHKPGELLAMVHLGIVHRAGFAPPELSRVEQLLSDQDEPSNAAFVPKFQSTIIPMPQMELSSTELRRRVGSGNSIRFRLPRAVEAYIAKHRLYQ